MNCNNYTNTLLYPQKTDFTVKFWYRGGHVVARQDGQQPVQYYGANTSEDLAKCVVEQSTSDAAYREAMRAYREEGERVKEQFKQDLFEDLGIEANPKRELLFTKAWENGHGTGYQAVYDEAADLVDLIL